MASSIEVPALETILYSDSQQEQFFRSMRELSRHMSCRYVLYCVEDLNQKTRLGFASDPDWQSQYIGQRLMEECHLWKTVNDQLIGTGRPLLIFPWECVRPQTRREREISLYRAEKDIGANGISFCSQRNGIREFFTVAPDPKSPRFLDSVAANMPLIHKHIRRFREASFIEPIAGTARRANRRPLGR